MKVISKNSMRGPALAAAALPALAAVLISGAWADQGAISDRCPLPPYVEADLLNLALKTPVYGGPQMYPAVTGVDDVTERVDEIFMPASLFPNAYAELVNLSHSYEPLGTSQGAPTVLSLTYEIGGQRYTAHAYFIQAADSSTSNAALIIPGSGTNQSSAIYSNDPKNYHYNIRELTERHWNTYVYVKPNEDFLAVHNGVKKLSQEYIIRPHLNAGGSYSCRYLADTMAIVKYMKSAYDKTVVLGLSQGGEAALYNSLQSHPDGTVVSSGYSVLWERLGDGGIGQIIIPGMKEIYGNQRVHEEIGNSNTKYLFTWGRQEQGVYGAEAEVECTAGFFSDLPNVTCEVHGGGHMFPRSLITGFLREIDGQAPIIAITPDSLVFGESYVGFAGSADLIVRNAGTGVLSISDVFSSDDEFAAEVTSLDLNPGEGAEVTVEFRPLAAGERSAILTIVSNDPGRPEALIQLSARAVEPPRIGIDPDSLAVLFNPVSPRTRTVTIANSGGSDLLFSAAVRSTAGVRAAADAPAADWIEVSPAEGTIAPGDSALLTVSLDGADLVDDVYTGEVVLTSNDPYSPQASVQVRMVVKRIEVARLRITPSTLNASSPHGRLKARVELPDGVDPSDVDPQSVLFQYAVHAEPSGAGGMESVLGDPHGLSVEFDRSAAVEVLPPGRRIPVTVAGEIGDRAWFFGVDSVTVIDGAEAAASQSAELGQQFAPLAFALHQSVPNPASGMVAVPFDLPRRCHVRLRLYDAAGRLVGTLADREMDPGRHSVSWDVRNGGSGVIAPGVYVYELVAGEFRTAKKMVISP
jgi:hypothetical protein